MPSWSKKFWKPFVLRDGREIATRADARDLLLALSEPHSRPHLQYAAELLIDAAERSNRASVDRGGAVTRALAAEGLLRCLTKNPAAFGGDGASRRKGLGGCSHALATVTGSGRRGSQPSSALRLRVAVLYGRVRLLEPPRAPAMTRWRPSCAA
jgi:hypothetical protein